MSEYASLAVCGVAYREKSLQEWSLEDAESLPKLPNSSLCVSQSGVLRYVLLG